MKTLDDLHPLIAYLREISPLQSAISLLSWDQETYMPKGGGEVRAEQLATLEGMAHQKTVGPKMQHLLSKWIDINSGKILEDQWDDRSHALLREVWRDFSMARKLPIRFVKRFAQVTSLAQQVWVEAKKDNDFALFAPHLKTIVSLKKEEADYMGYQQTPYNALLDHYEPGLTVAVLAPLFASLKGEIGALLDRVIGSPVRLRDDFIHRFYPEKAQLVLGRIVLQAMGYRLDQGRQDLSAHPFTTSFHPTDVRITTRVCEQDLLSSLFSTLHEGGHALYDQGLDPQYFGTPLGEAISLGIHESQSRLWENGIGRSISFWKYFLPILKETFPRTLEDIDIDDFYASVNIVRPSLIRVEADELTYNLHIMVRFEIERALIEQDMPVSDLPSMWREKMTDALGIAPHSDTDGVLQDVHWSCGAFGYFPTYTLGNLCAAQFLAQAKHDLPDLTGDIAQGRLATLTAWLNKKIHCWGRRYSSDELLRQVTGEPLNPDHFMEYLTEKYTEVYRL